MTLEKNIGPITGNISDLLFGDTPLEMWAQAVFNIGDT